MSFCINPTCRRLFTTEQGLRTHLSHSTCGQILRENTMQLQPIRLERPTTQDEEESLNFGLEEDILEDDVSFDFPMSDAESFSGSSPPSPPMSSSTNRLPMNRDENDRPMHYYIRRFKDPNKNSHSSGKTPYQVTHENECDPENITYPFTNMEEWKLAKWLGSSGLPGTQVNQFLKLDLGESSL